MHGRLRTPNHCETFQANVAAIEELRGVVSVSQANIYSVSQSAIMALGSLVVNLDIVKESLLTLSIALT